MKKLIKKLVIHVGLAAFYGIIAYFVGVLLSLIMK